MILDGASAIVTGGAGGFGEQTVRQLVAAGMKVVIADMAADRGKALAGDLADAAVFVETDVTEEDSVKNAIGAATELAPLRVAVIVHGGSAAAARVVGRWWVRGRGRRRSWP